MEGKGKWINQSKGSVRRLSTETDSTAKPYMGGKRAAPRSRQSESTEIVKPSAKQPYLPNIHYLVYFEDSIKYL